MKKIFVSCALIALAVAFIAVGVNLKPVGAQGRPNDPGSQSARRADGKVVAPDGVVFESHKAFIDAGRKCSTRHVDDLELEEIEKHVKSNRGNGSGKTGGGG